MHILRLKIKNNGVGCDDMKKRRYYIFAAILLIAAIFTAGAIILSADRNNVSENEYEQNNNSYPSTVTNSFFSQKEEKEFYTIKTTPEGKVGVYKSQMDEPVLVFHEILLMALPKFDRQLLKDGITVYSDEELYALIEDIDS